MLVLIIITSIPIRLFWLLLLARTMNTFMLMWVQMGEFQMEECGTSVADPREEKTVVFLSLHQSALHMGWPKHLMFLSVMMPLLWRKTWWSRMTRTRSPWKKRIFNYRHSRARRISENLFGIIANRWRVFRTVLQLAPSSTESLVRQH